MSAAYAADMTSLDEVGGWIREQLPRLIAKHDVPAAGVAVCVGDQVVDAAEGVLSRATGVEATTDSLFQIGSITKVWTATLVMQLVDEGLVELDAPVRKYLPQFRVSDAWASEAITVRQLLCHTAGFEGDLFTDTGRGDDALGAFVDALGDVDQLFPPGQLFSYNNAGYSVLGRLVEKLRDAPYDECLGKHLIQPLELKHAAASPYEAILFRVAVGHLPPKPGAEQEPAPLWAMPRSNSPAGAMLAMRARDLISFAQMHLTHGAGANGPVLQPESVSAMQHPEIVLPDLRVMGAAWGLGWELFDNEGPGMIGHDGNTVGQASFLRVVPELGVAVALLTNGGDPYGLYLDVVGHVLEKLTGITVPPLPTPPSDPPDVDATPYVGTYSNRVIDITVSQDDQGKIWSVMQPKGAAVELGGLSERSELVGFAPDVLIPVDAKGGIHIPHAFIGADDHGPAKYLHVGRAVPRRQQ